MKRIQISLLALAIFLGITMALLLWLSRPGFVAEAVSSAIRAQTGLEVEMPIPPRLTWIPSPHVSLESVRLKGPQGVVAEIPEINVAITLRDVFARRFTPGRIDIERPLLQLAVNGAGEINWAKGPAAVAGLPPLFIHEGELRFLDERSGDSFAASGIDGRLDASEGLSFDGGILWGADRLRLSLYLRRPADIATSGSAADITFGSARLNFNFSGQARLSQGLALAGQMEAEVPDLTALADWTGAKMPPASTQWRFWASGPFEAQNGRMEFRDAVFRLNGMNGKGSLSLATRGGRLELGGSLGLDMLRLENFSGAAAAPDDGWSDSRFDLSGLAAMDADLAITTDSFSWHDVALRDARLGLSLKSGVLAVQLAQGQLGKGTVTGSARLENANPPKLALQLAATGADAAPALGLLLGTRAVSGAADLKLDATASGESPADMVAHLAGEGSLRVADGVIADVDLPGLASTLARKTITGWAPVAGTGTAITTLSLSFRLSDGVGETRDLTLAGPRIRLAGAGDFDLLRRMMELTLTPAVADAGDGKFHEPLAVALKAAGPWAKPKFYPDMPGVLDDETAAYAALKAMKKANP